MKQRIAEYDLAKGFAAILVIYGHIDIGSTQVRNIIYAFHMPLFFLIAGMFLKIRGDKHFVKNKAKSLLVPAFLLELFVYISIVCKQILVSNFTFSWAVKRFLGIFVQIGYSEFSGGLWFMPNIFLCFLIAYRLICMRKMLGMLLCGLLYALSYVYCIYLKDLFLPWRIEVVPIGLLFMMVGYYVKEGYLKMKSHSFIFVPIFTVASAALVWYCYYIRDYYYAIDGHALGGFLSSPVLAIVFGFNILLLFSVLSDIHIPLKGLTYMGKTSMVYYGVQQVTVNALAMITPKIVSLVPLPTGIISIGILLLAVLGSTVLVILWNTIIQKRLPT